VSPSGDYAFVVGGTTAAEHTAVLLFVRK